jgi:hypothetical protein
VAVNHGSATHVIDVSVGDWIAPRLAPFASCVGALVPRGFAAYARIAHRDEHVSATGIPADLLVVISELLRRQGVWTGCSFAVWAGYGWEGGGGVLVGCPDTVPVDHERIKEIKAAAATPAFPLDVLNGPKLSLPHRAYIVFAGPLAAALELGDYRMHTFSPDLIWPRDRSWFLGTDTDLDFTYLGGSAALARELLDDARLDAVSVVADDPLEPDDRDAVAAD